MGTIENRLRRIEQAIVPKEERPPGICTDEEGRVLDSGHEMIRQWIGWHYSELPKWGCKIYIGVDPSKV
jgi:hypothetical protein